MNMLICNLGHKKETITNRIKTGTIFFAIFFLIGCEVLSDSPDVLYRVEGSPARVNLGYHNDKGELILETDVLLPWDYTFYGEDGDYLYLSADTHESEGMITVSIIVDGDVFAKSQRSGMAAVEGWY